ncbi:MAG: alanine racemase [Nitrospirae bacterium]|nr:MAG: alanine racemase [Nitrospirota bacterium]
MTDSCTPCSASPHFPLVATISLSALAHNVAVVRQLLSPSCKILAVIKADAYGHGAQNIAEALVRQSIPYFGVATVYEGVALRQHGIRQPILIMGGLLPELIPDLLRFQLIPVIGNWETALALSHDLKQRAGTAYPVHLKIDTGMRRLGFSPDDVLALLDHPDLSRIFQFQGLMTHLADADNLDPTFTQQQLQSFENLIQRIRKRGVSIPLIHAANSTAIFRYPEAHLDLVRPGLALYGYHLAPLHDHQVSLKPIMTVSTRIVHLRTVSPGESLGYNGAFRTMRRSRIAVLPIGYYHGLARRLSNRGQVLVRGQRVPIVGKICMDMTMIDVTDVPSVTLGDPVVLIGQQSQGHITAMDIAEWQETVPYEVLCAIGSKASRVYESTPTLELHPREAHAPAMAIPLSSG